MYQLRELVGVLAAGSGEEEFEAIRAIRGHGLLGDDNWLFVARGLGQESAGGSHIIDEMKKCVYFDRQQLYNAREFWLGAKQNKKALFDNRNSPFPVYFISSIFQDLNIWLERRRKDDFSQGKPIGFFKFPLHAIDGDLEPRPRRGPAEFLSDGVKNQLRGADGPILLHGPTGTGKTEHAYLIQQLIRPGKVLGEENCAAIQDNDREARFRGVAKGAFTGAVERPSVFMENHNGTLLLDDFQDLSPRDQTTFLDLIDPFSNLVRGTRLGGTARKDDGRWEADVQVIVAINRPLNELLSKGQLREDVYYRLPRRIALPTLKQELRDLSLPLKEAWFRHQILSMQERGIRLQASSWEGTGTRKEIWMKSIGCIEKDEGYFIIPRNASNQDMPINNIFLSNEWNGNWRDLDAVARKLWYGRDFLNNKLGFWSEIDIENAVDYSYGQKRTEPGHEASSLISESASRFFSLAHLFAVRKENIKEASGLLGLDPRTLKVRLFSIIESKLTTTFTRDLTNSELDELKENARRLVMRKHPGPKAPN